MIKPDSFCPQFGPSVCPLVSILTNLSNWSRQSHFAWLPSVETVKSRPDKHCFPGFVWPISAWPGPTCVFVSGETLQRMWKERTIMERTKTIRFFLAGLVTVNKVLFLFSFPPMLKLKMSVWLVCCNKTSFWLVVVTRLVNATGPFDVCLCASDKNQVPHTSNIKHKDGPA